MVEEKIEEQDTRLEDYIKLAKTSTEKFSWEIKLYGKNHNKMLEDIDNIHQKLKAKYGKKKIGATPIQSNKSEAKK